MRRIAVSTAAWLLVPATAHAVNGLRPRTPAQFEDVPCLLEVDKAEASILRIDYAVSYDDIELTPDELPDSRRMQFFAFSRERWNFARPTWINQSDYDRSLANGDIMAMYTDDDILEISTLWSPDEWIRITPDDSRVPITMAQAAMGVEWDLSTVPVGTWTVAAYTWEPEQNLWSFRLGAVRIVDGAAPEQQPGPTVFLQDAEIDGAEVDVPYALSGCVKAESGSTVSADWGVIEGIAEPTWVTFVTDEPVADGELRLDLVPPPETDGAQIKIRVEVVEPDGQRMTSYSPAPIPVTCPEGCTEDATDGSDSGSGDPTSASGDDAGDEGESTDAASEGAGFGCRAVPPPGTAPSWAPLFLVFGTRRGRRR